MVTFLYPALLAALFALPLLWYLLRVTPPPPKRIFFPSAHFLIGLISEKTTASKTPWWILLLRLLMVALVIIALSRPVLNQSDTLSGNGAIRILLDNSWAAAQLWDLQTAQAEELISQAGRQNREIYILTTAPIIGQNTPMHTGALSQADALATLRGLTPLPYGADYKAITKILQAQQTHKKLLSFWLSHGLDEGEFYTLAEKLRSQGGLEVFKPNPAQMPLILRPAATADLSGGVPLSLETTSAAPQGLRTGVQAIDSDGRILDIQEFNLDQSKRIHAITLDIPQAVQGNLAQFRLSQRKGAGAVLLLDDSAKKRSIGIASGTEGTENAPLIEDSFYIKRALEPFATIKQGSINDLIAQKLPMIILPDIAAMPAQTLNALEAWVRDGGLLLRFSGETMAKSQGGEFLLPVRLRAGGRSLSGAMTWEKPQSIAPFDETSPFYGLNIPQDLSIRQQILADPAQNLDGKVWAQLKDGTPLITAAAKDKGLIVLVHTTASPAWSDLALSGLYVNILRRISAMAGKNITASKNISHANLEPLSIMDGYGALQPAGAQILPLPVKDAEKFIPDSKHPPGIYGHGGMQFALNLGANLPSLKIIDSLPTGVIEKTYEEKFETDLMPALLLAAMGLYLLDWVIMIFLTGYFSRKKLGMGFTLNPLRRAAIIFMCASLSSIASAQAFAQAATGDNDLRYAGGLYLAYIKTADTELNALCQRGLENLSATLNQRTSVEPEGVIGLDPRIDNLAFFPIIYWAVDPVQTEISDDAIKNIQYYLDHGGTILFDTRDQNGATNITSETSGIQALKNITGSLNIPPLAPIGDKHVLGQSFYILKNYTGRFSRGTLWIEQDATNGRDGVSSVIIGSNDWASAWASYENEYNAYRFNSSAQTPQPEMAMRFGVNLVMYALTGNYKADQVHIPHILERMGE